MASKESYVKKITINIPQALYDRLYHTLEWGERNRILVRLIEWMVDKIERHGEDALILLLREGDLNKLITMNSEAGKDGNH